MFINKYGLSTNNKPRKEAYIQGGVLGQQISKNYIRGGQIDTVDDIRDLAGLNKAIYHSRMGIKPAAVFYQWSLCQLDICLRRGYLSTIIKIK